MNRLRVNAIPQLAFLATSVVCILGSQTASAGTVSVNGSTLAYDAAPGEANTVAFRCTSTECFVGDQTAPVTAGPGCASSGAEHRCTAPGFESILVVLGDGDDLASNDPNTAAQLPFTVDGGDGADRLTGSAQSDLIDGGPGADIIEGGQGDDSLRGGCGNDGLDGGEDDDTITGNVVSGPGSVTVCRSRGGQAEADNDTLLGGAGNDGLFDEAGRNRFRGDDGNDNIRGRVRASRNANVVVGGSGRDRMIITGSGRVRARDGFRDRIVCTGSGLNVLADRTLDTVGGTCPEARKRRAEGRR
jgi:Ca2+-binding RTX toxin-like protein